MDIHATIEELREVVSSVQSVPELNSVACSPHANYLGYLTRMNGKSQSWTGFKSAGATGGQS
jgi:hypothetical protein